MIANDTDAQFNASKPDLLAVSIGNTRVAMSAMLNGQPVEPCGTATDDMTRITGVLTEMWGALGVETGRAVVIASVVPEALTRIRDMVATDFDVDALVIRETVEMPMDLAIDNPKTVGVDRVCCAAAAYDRLRTACVVVDLGTAVTIDCVSDQGVFLGGAILPGLELSARSLNLHTAALPLVEFAIPDDPIGRDTEQAIRSGIYYGLAGAIREFSERYATSIGHWPHVVLTGGNAELIAKACDFVDSVVPHLALMGIDLAYRKHLAKLPE